MNKAKKNHHNKIKRRYVEFYLCDGDLYEYSKTINFQKVVKSTLRLQMILDKIYSKYGLDSQGSDKKEGK